MATASTRSTSESRARTTLCASTSEPEGPMHTDLVRKYAAQVPRYTSYPTAPHFRPNIGNVQYVCWLAALPEAVRLSLYVHIPAIACAGTAVVTRRPLSAMRPLLATCVRLKARSPALARFSPDRTLWRTSI